MLSMHTKERCTKTCYKDTVDNTELEITVGHRTLSDQISRMSGQFHIMIGHDDRTSCQHTLSYLLGDYFLFSEFSIPDFYQCG